MVVSFTSRSLLGRYNPTCLFLTVAAHVLGSEMKIVSRLVQWNFSPQSSKRNLSEGVIISDLVFMNIVQVKWILVYDVKWGANFFYTYMCSYSHIRLYIHTHTHTSWDMSTEAIISLLCILGAFVKNINTPQLHTLILGFSMYFFFLLFVTFYSGTSLLDYGGFVINIEIT